MFKNLMPGFYIKRACGFGKYEDAGFPEKSPCRSRLEEADSDLLFGGLFIGATGEFDTAGADAKSVFLTALIKKTVCRRVLSGNDPEHSARVI